jgi:transposase
MVATRITLPDLSTLDQDALKAVLLATHEQLIAIQQQLLDKNEQLLSRDHEIEHLKLLIAKRRRMQFGRKSEKVERQIEQLELKLEDLEANRTEPAPPPAIEPAPSEPVSSRKKRRTLPDHLRREIQTHEPEQHSCPQCGGTLKKLGEDVSEVLEWVPASFKVIRHVRPKLCCTGCDVIVQAPAPSRRIDRGMAGPGLLAHVLTSKFVDHLPLYRQSEIYVREGVEFDRSTMAKWVGEASQLLEPLVEALRRYVMAADKLHGDDTPVPVLAPGNGKTKTGRLWTCVRDDRPAGSTAAPAVWFAYSPDRKGEHPQQHLSKFAGILQADAYVGFNKLYEGGAIQEAPCLAHIRRKFFDLMEAHNSPIATEAVERIAHLYEIEKEIRGRSPDERREVRNRKARPLLESMHTWLESCLSKLSRKSVYEGTFDDPKTKRSRRTVPLSKSGIAILASYNQAESNPEALVFATRQETPLSRRNLLNRQLKPTSEKLGLKGANWHWLRHANATLLDAVGAPLGTVQALLVHASAEITREVYLHAVPADAKSAIQKVEDLIGPKRTQVPVWPEPLTLVTP